LTRETRARERLAGTLIVSGSHNFSHYPSRRNGGHVNPELYLEYGKLKKNYGEQMAKRLIRFRSSHFAELKRVSEEEGILEQTQCRDVEHCDVYYDPEIFDSAKKKLEVYKTDMATEADAFQVHNSQEAIEVFRDFSADCRCA
jgi:hypothetical protein